MPILYFNCSYFKSDNCEEFVITMQRYCSFLFDLSHPLHLKSDASPSFINISSLMLEIYKVMFVLMASFSATYFSNKSEDS